MFLKRYKKTGLYGQSFYLNIFTISQNTIIVIGAPTTNTPIYQSGTGQKTPTKNRIKNMNATVVATLSSFILVTPKKYISINSL